MTESKSDIVFVSALLFFVIGAIVSGAMGLWLFPFSVFVIFAVATFLGHGLILARKSEKESRERRRHRPAGATTEDYDRELLRGRIRKSLDANDDLR